MMSLVESELDPPVPPYLTFCKEMRPCTKEDLDWMRTLEAAERGYNKEKIKIYEQLWRKKQDLEVRINSAFDGVVLGEGVGIIEADERDTCCDPEELKLAREKDERKSWRVISENDLYRYHYALCFTDAEGFRFMIPAFMLADLSCLLDESTLIHLSLVRDDSYDQYSMLNATQLATIIDFLELYREDPDSKFHHEAIDQSLAVFWQPRLMAQKNAEQACTSNGG
jgi:hypothetical protein